MNAAADDSSEALEKSIVFIGMRGSGKTSVGTIVAQRLGRRFVDLDQRIEQQAGATITEIFARDGEAHFRALESAALASELASIGEPIVLSVGGGAVLRDESRRLLCECVCVWLKAPPAVLAERITQDGTTPHRRPALTNLPPVDELTRLLSERSSLYHKLAGLEIDTANRSPADVADAVMAKLSAPSAAARKARP